MLGFRKRHHGDIAGLAVSPDGQRCVTGAIASPFPDVDARIWALPALKVLTKLRGHDAAVGSAAWSPNGRQIATAGGTTFKFPNHRRIDDHAVRLWDAQSGAQTGILGLDLRFVSSLAYSADSQLLLTGSSAGKEKDRALVRLWDLRSQKEVARLGVHYADVHSIAFSPDQTMIASGGFRPFKAEPVPSFGLSVGPVMVHAPDAASRIPTLRLFEVAGGQEIRRFDYSQHVNDIRFSPNGGYLFSVGTEYLMWDMSTGRLVLQFRSEGSTWASSVDVSTDGRHVAIGCGQQTQIGRYTDCCVRLWRLDTPREIANYPHKYPVRRVAFIPYQKLLVAAGGEGEIRVWPLPED